MPLTSRTFRIFISSTFNDFVEERNVLQTWVFPRLRQHCLANGTRFQVVDLRWGISEDATVQQQTLRICLNEIERCRKVSPCPNFLALLGDRYGWCPLPDEIPINEFEHLLDHLSYDERGRAQAEMQLNQ
jgi:hypothetical protein